MSELLQCGWNENVRQCHWINCHGEGPCSGISASQFTRSRAEEITCIQASLAAAEAERDEERAIVSRIWNLLGSPTYEELKGRSIYDLIRELQSALSEREATIAGYVTALKLYEEAQTPGKYQFCGHWPGYGELQPLCECDSTTGCQRVRALANAPARASAMVDVVKAVDRLIGCEIVSISWANAYDALKAAQARLRSLEDKAGETP